MGKPGFAFHFIFKLAGTPASVADEHFHFACRGKRFADVGQFIERMAEVEIGHHVGVGDEIVSVQKTQASGLNRAAEIERRFLENIRQIGHDHLVDFLFAGTIEDQTECAFVIVLADQDDCVLEERTTQLPAVQKQLALKIFWLGRHLVQTCIKFVTIQHKDSCADRTAT